jgi:DNA repair exonuclease SbcCD ATPase subunit
MSEKMPSPREPDAGDDHFRKLEAILLELRAAATAAAESPDSWARRAFNPSPSSPRQGAFNVTLIEALAETLEALRATAANQETHLERIAKEMSEIRALSENLDAFRERSDRLETELRSAAANVRGLQERSAALETTLAQFRDEHNERIQHLLDEQRICIRQLSLQASEEAVLADRARRATELRLEELARRVAPPPA